MAAPEQKKKFALDTNVLLDLAADKDFAHTFREVFQEKGYALMVPPTAICHRLLAIAHGAPILGPISPEPPGRPSSL
jgi:hypothetical protein